MQHIDSDHVSLLPRLSRRAVLAGSAAIALGHHLAFGQESPPIEPIGPESTTEPTEIEPEEDIPAAEDTSTASGSVQSGEDVQYFAQTGHNLGLPFLETWKAVGGLEVIGAPLSEIRYVEDRNQTWQTFETLTLIYDPQQQPDWLISALALEQKVVNAIAPANARKQVALGAAGTWFPETGHTISGAFAVFWNAHGGLQLFGLPLSEPFKKEGSTIQVFERVVMEQPAGGAVALRRLGAQWVKDKGLEHDKAFVPSPPAYGETALVKSPDGLRLRGGPSADAEVIMVLDDNAEFMAVAGSSGEWVPGYVDGHSGWVSGDFLTKPTGVPSKGDVKTWKLDVWEGEALGETNVRRDPSTGSPEQGTLAQGDSIVVTDWVKGEEVVENSYIWAKLEGGGFVFARNVGRAAPVAPPTPVPDDAPWEGKWIDIHLTQQLLVAYENRNPVRTIVVTTGMPGWETPTGFYAINNRVENETMESGAIGADYFFKLENVLYTQYFTDRGHALHYAWWRTPETIGRPGSHGCINMLLDDSKFLWDWAGIGTPVYIRNT